MSASLRLAAAFIVPLLMTGCGTVDNRAVAPSAPQTLSAPPVASPGPSSTPSPNPPPPTPPTTPTPTPAPAPAKQFMYVSGTVLFSLDSADGSLGYVSQFESTCC